MVDNKRRYLVMWSPADVASIYDCGVERDDYLTIDEARQELLRRLDNEISNLIRKITKLQIVRSKHEPRSTDD